MYGKSWGGFNGLQQGFTEGEESPLRTAISLYSLDDRYKGDIHYEGGAVIGNGMLSWASEMLVRNAIPPPPRCFAEKSKWLEAWKERLEKASKSPASSWLHHQTPGTFWNQGSIAANYEKLTMPVLAIGGLEDGYKDSATKMARYLNEGSRVVVGPWCHDWPDSSTAVPNTDFLTMCLTWYSYHLKDQHVDDSNKCSDWPRYQLFVRDSFKPSDITTRNDIGRFIEFDDWVSRSVKLDKALQDATSDETGPPNKMLGALYLTSLDDQNKLLLTPPGSAKHYTVKLFSNSLQGANSGVWCPYGTASGFAGDQATAIANSVSFTSSPLKEQVVMMGHGQFILRVTASSWDRVYMSIKVSGN